MPSIEYAGMKVTGGKVFAILTLLGALGSGAWATFTFYQDYLDMKDKILTYTEPDLSGFDKKILQAIGWGDTKPITSNATAQGRSQNRRVVVRIVKK